MPFDDETILASYCADYRARDIIGCLRHFTDDIVFAVYLDPGLVTYAGITIGRRALQRRLEDIDAQIEVTDFRVASAQQTATDLHGSVAFRFVHRRTGQDIAGSFRVIATLRDGKFCRFEAHHDRARFEAFFRLIRLGPEHGAPAAADDD